MNRSTYLIALAALWCGMTAMDTHARPQTQLFLDDAHVASEENIQRVVQQPTKRREPVISGDDPWQANPYMFGSVIYDREEKVFKAWYQSFDLSLPIGIRTPVLYATSQDGIEWDYPNVGNVAFDGSTDNNILFIGKGIRDLYSPSVIKDPYDPDSDQRYKMIYWDTVHRDYYHDPDNRGGGGMFTAVSPDGINWTRSENAILPARKAENAISDVMDLMQDPQSGNYVVYTKGWADPWPDHRQIVRTESADFVNWSEPEVVVRHERDEVDPQSYGMPVFQYEGMYIGLMRRYRNPGDETIDIQLLVSRDNKNWDYVDREQPLMEPGHAGEWDSGMLFTAPPIVHGDEVRIYYGGWDGPHNSRSRNAQIGLATMPAGRFVALKAEGERGVLATKPFLLEQGQLHLNAKASGGAIRVAVLDAEGRSIGGLTWDEAKRITDDVAHGLVEWQGEASLTDLIGQNIRLQFELTGDAELYGYQIIP